MDPRGARAGAGWRRLPRPRGDGPLTTAAQRGHWEAPPAHAGMDPLELATTHMEMVLGDHGAEDRLSDLAKEDPEMLDLVLGMLFNFDP